MIEETIKYFLRELSTEERIGLLKKRETDKTTKDPSLSYKSNEDLSRITLS